MSKISPRRLPDVVEQNLKRDFEKILRSLEDDKILTNLLFSLLTDSEIVMCARRLKIAELLMRGQPYSAIGEDLRVAQRTIESVDRWLSSYRDYRTVFPALLQKSTKSRRPAFPESLTALRRKYPLHFLLFNILLGE